MSGGPMYRGLSPRADERRAELAALYEIISACFNVSTEDAERWLSRYGHEWVRLWDEDGSPTATLSLIPMGHFFGGRSVPMMGIAAVGVPPHLRGGGRARCIVGASLREIRDSGYPLSALYPATRTVYRRCGFEIAGSRFAYTLPLDAIPAGDAGPLEARPITEPDMERVRALYARCAARDNGMVDRGEFVWRRVRTPRAGEARGFGVWRARELEGYIFLVQKAGSDFRYVLDCADLRFETPEAGRALLGLLAAHRSLAKDISWIGPAHDPITDLLPEQSWEAKSDCEWMLRIADVAGALRGRGYPGGVTAELHLRIRDDLLADNSDDFILRIAEGEGQVEPGGSGSLEMDIRALAALYTGFADPLAMLTTGMLSATKKQALAARAMFAGPAPWMPDMF